MSQNNSSRNIMHQINRVTNYSKSVLNACNSNDPYLKTMNNLSSYNQILLSIKNAKRIINLTGIWFVI